MDDAVKLIYTGNGLNLNPTFNYKHHLPMGLAHGVQRCGVSDVNFMLIVKGSLGTWKEKKILKFTFVNFQKRKIQFLLN